MTDTPWEGGIVEHPLVIKLANERRGEHVHCRVFAGDDEEHLALTGTLVMNVGEWQLFGAALMLGEKQMRGHLRVYSEPLHERVEVKP